MSGPWARTLVGIELNKKDLDFIRPFEV